MAQLPNPNHDKPYQRVITNQGGDPLYGLRNEGTPDEEIVHIPSGQSNQQYYVPDMVLNPEGCDHTFEITHIGKREVECTKCHVPTSFIPGLNYREDNGASAVRYHHVWYPICL